MIFLRELIKAYDRLPDHKPEYGYFPGKVSYCINLKGDGSDFEVIDIRQQSQNNNKLPRNLNLPMAPTRAGSKISPHFLWDNIEYVLGSYKINEKTGYLELDQTNLSKHKEFKKKHLELLLQKNEHTEIMAFCNFIKSWEANKDQLEKLLSVIPSPNESKGDNFVFAHDSSYRDRFLHENLSIKDVWLNCMNVWNGVEQIQGTCFLTGKTGTIERTHPKIKGVYGSHTTGAPLISFNKKSFNSFGREQGYNAPISERSAFYYSTVLNSFLNDARHKIVIGETTFVFWTSSSDIHTDEKQTAIFAEFVNPSDMEEISDSNIKSYLQAIRRGVALNVPELDQETRFFVLGLSPNKSRIFVRFFWEGHFGNLINNFQKYFDETAVSANDINRLPILCIVKALAVQNKSKNIIPRLAVELLDSILTGKGYPVSLLTNSVIRIRADGKVSPPRVAVMKAILIRNFNRKVPMTLDKNFSNRGYVLGRLFSVYEEIQKAALVNVNASIKDKYYGLASASPQQAFRMLDIGTQHHLAKIRKVKPGLAINLEKKISSIMELMVPGKEPIPISLNLSEQAMFGVGYYHQRNNSSQKNKNINQIDEVSND